MLRMRIRPLKIGYLLFVFIIFPQNSIFSREVKYFSLRDVIDFALKSSFDIKKAKIDFTLSGLERMYKEGLYSPQLGVGGSYLYNKKKPYGSAALFGNETTQVSGYTFLRKHFSTGTSIEVKASSLYYKSNPSFSSFMPYLQLPKETYTASLELTIKQSLLKNFLGSQERKSLESSIYKQKEIKNRIAFLVSSIVVKAVSLFFSAKISALRVKTAKENLDNSKYVYAIILRRYKLGTSDYSDLLEWQAVLKQLDSAYRNAILEYKKGILELKDFLGTNKDIAIKVEGDLKKDKPVVSYNSLVREALKNRYDLKAAKFSVASKRMNYLSKKRELLPDVNLILKIASNGEDLDFTSSLEEAPTFEYRQNYVGFEAVYNFDNKKARADFKMAKADYSKSVLELKRLENSIKNEIKKAVEEVNTSFLVYKNAYDNLVLAKKAFDEVFRNYRLGRYNVFRLRNALSNLTKAKELYNISLIKYNISLVNLDFLSGRLLKRFNIDLDRILK